MPNQEQLGLSIHRHAALARKHGWRTMVSPVSGTVYPDHYVTAAFARNDGRVLSLRYRVLEKASGEVVTRLAEVIERLATDSSRTRPVAPADLQRVLSS